LLRKTETCKTQGELRRCREDFCSIFSSKILEKGNVLERIEGKKLLSSKANLTITLLDWRMRTF